MLYRHSNSLETGHFGHRTADYAWAVALMGLIILVRFTCAAEPMFYSASKIRTGIGSPAGVYDPL